MRQATMTELTYVCFASFLFVFYKCIILLPVYLQSQTEATATVEYWNFLIYKIEFYKKLAASYLPPRLLIHKILPNVNCIARRMVEE